MQVDRVARLDRAEEILVVVDGQIGMVATLHEHAGAADRERLLDLLEDDRLRQQVRLAAVARAAVERAEVAVGDADVGVVEVAIDDECDRVRVRAPRAQLLRSLADRDEVARLEQRDGVLVGDPFAIESLVEHGADAAPLGRGSDRHAGTSSWTKGSSRGPAASSPTSPASSRNRSSPARSRGPKLKRSCSKYRAIQPAG